MEAFTDLDVMLAVDLDSLMLVVVVGRAEVAGLVVSGTCELAAAALDWFNVKFEVVSEARSRLTCRAKLYAIITFCSSTTAVM